MLLVVLLACTGVLDPCAVSGQMSSPDTDECPQGCCLGRDVVKGNGPAKGWTVATAALAADAIVAASATEPFSATAFDQRPHALVGVDRPLVVLRR